MNEEAEEKIIDLAERRRIRQATGGSGPTGTGKDWLTPLGHGTRFLARNVTQPGSEVDDFVVSTPPIAESVVLLAKNIKGRDGVFEWHDPEIFCRNHKLYCVMEIISFDNNKSIQSDGVDGDEGSQVQSEVHEPEQ